MSVGFGKNTSSMSETTSMLESVVPAYMPSVRIYHGGSDHEYTHGHREEIQGGVEGDNGDLCTRVLVRQAIQILEDCPGGGSDHTGLHSSMADVDQEYVDRGLRWADHVFRWRDELDYGVVELSARPTVPRLIPCLVPIKQLRNFIGHRTHAASPAASGAFSIYEGTHNPAALTDCHHQ